VRRARDHVDPRPGKKVTEALVRRRPDHRVVLAGDEADPDPGRDRALDLTERRRADPLVAQAGHPGRVERPHLLEQEDLFGLQFLDPLAHQAVNDRELLRLGPVGTDHRHYLVVADPAERVREDDTRHPIRMVHRNAQRRRRAQRLAHQSGPLDAGRVEDRQDACGKFVGVVLAAAGI
jgi:hypothetical protein